MQEHEWIEKGQYCGNCFFFDNKHCRKNPPTIIPVTWSDHVFKDESIRTVEVTLWPAPPASDWCGEWKPEE